MKKIRHILTNNNFDYILFYTAVLIISIGVLFSYSLTTYTTAFYGKSEFYFFYRQLFYGLFSIVVIYILSNIKPNYILIKPNLVLYLFFFIFIVVMLLVVAIGSEVGGAKRWIKLGPISIAPVEFFKIGFIAYLSHSFYKKIQHHKNKTVIDELKTLAPWLVIFFLSIVLVAIFQKDLGQAVVLSVVLLSTLIYSKRNWKFILSFILAGLLAVILLIIFFPHRVKRIKSWWGYVQDSILPLFPDSISQYLKITNPPDIYQISNSINAIKNGSIFGVGIGNGTYKLGFLGEVHTDFVLAGITEEIGIVGISFIILLFFILLYRIFLISINQHNKIYKLFSFGVGVMILSMIIINSFGITGILPIKGLPVPLLSYGGSATVATAIAIGIVLSISTQTKMK